MKELLKEYFRTKGSKWRVGLCFICMTILSIVDAKTTIWISTITGNTDNPGIYIKYLRFLSCGMLMTIGLSLVLNLILRDLHHMVYTHLNNKVGDLIIDADYDLFTRFGAGKINTVIKSTNSIANGGAILLEMIQAITSILVTSVSICIIEELLIIPLGMICLVAVVGFKAIYRKIIKLDNDADKIADIRNDELHKIIQGFSEVRSNCTQEFHRNKIREYNTECYHKFHSKSKIVAVHRASIETINNVLTMVAVLYAIIAIPQGLAPEIAMSIVIYSCRLIYPLVQMVSIMDTVSMSSADYIQYKQLMDEKSIIHDGGIVLEEFNSSIRFDNVSFSYDKSGMVLDQITLSIKKGERVGICGYSGGGKSTLLKLIPRFYDVTTGRIMIDGIDIRELTQESLRQRIGIVHQSSYTFNGDIWYNVTYGISNVTEIEVVNACKAACIYDFIMGLPDGFRTDVGPNGLKLSGGQQQRIALARLFLRNPEIILLDESTSALDNESEALIQEHLKLFDGKTIITIAHRLSTIQDFDRIVVIDEHKVAEEGTHEELLNKRGIYYNLYHAK